MERERERAGDVEAGRGSKGVKRERKKVADYDLMATE